MINLRSQVMSGLRWSAGMRLLGQLFTWAVTLIVIRILSPADYGLMELAGVFIGLLSLVNEMGLGSAVVQRKDLEQEDLKAIFGFILVVSLFICCLLMTASPLIAGFYNEPKLIPMLWTLSLIFLFSGLAVVPQSLLLKNLQYKKIASIELASVISGSICTLIMALNGMGVWSLIGGFLTMRIISMFGFYIMQPFLHLPKLKLKKMTSIFKFSGQVTLSRILWFFYSTAAASLIVGKVLGKEALGFYCIGLYLACLPMEKVGGLLHRVAFPAFSSIQDTPDLVGSYFVKAARMLCFITIPIFWGMSSIAPEIVNVFLGQKWAGAIVPFQIIAFIVPLRMVRNLMAPALLGMGRGDVNLNNEIVAVVLMPLAFLVASFWGVIGVSLVWIMVFPIVFLVNFLKTSAVLKFTALDIYREVKSPLFSGLVMYLCIAAMKLSSILNFSDAVNMAIYIVVGGFIYTTMSFLFNRPLLEEVVELAKA